MRRQLLSWLLRAGSILLAVQCFTMGAAAQAPPPRFTQISPNSANQGDSNVAVTILGGDLQSGAQVSFSGTGITVNSMVWFGPSELRGAIRIDVNAPPGARDITITNPDGQSVTAAGAFTVIAVPTPTITSLSQTIGYHYYQVNVDIFGANFQNGSTVSVSGTGATPAGPVLFFDSGHLLVPIQIQGSAPKGPRDITVTDTAGRSGTCNGCFTVMGVTPIINSITPNQILASQTNVPVQVVGDNFIDNPQLVSLDSPALRFGLGVQVGAVTTNTMNLTVNDPAFPGPAGVYPLKICNRQNLYPSGVGGLVLATPSVLCTEVVGAFTVVAQSSPPQVTSVMPSSATAGSVSVLLTIAGSNFQSGAQVSFSGAGISVGSVTFLSATQLDLFADISAGAAAGARDVTVTNPDGQSATLAAGFTVSPPTGPIVAGITPAQIREDQRNILLQISGMNFPAGAQVCLNGTQVSYCSSPSELTITPTAIDFLFPNSGPLFPGVYDVRVCAQGLCGTLPGGLTVTAASQPPSIISQPPVSVLAGHQNFRVTILGADFQPGATVSFSHPGITVNSIPFNIATQLNVNIAVSRFAAGGSSDITVMNPDGLSATGTNLLTIIPAPALIVSPSPAQVGQPVTASWDGSGFGTDSQTVDFGDGRINSDIFSPQNHTYTTPGIYTLQLFLEESSGAQHLISTATLTVAGGAAPPPQITAVSPSSAQQGSSPLLMIMGSDFQSGAQVSFSGSGIAVTNVTFASSSQLNVDVSIAASTPPGPQDVTVTNPDGQSATLAGAFSISPPPAPVVTGISPSQIREDQRNILLRISGMNFVAGVQVGLIGAQVSYFSFPSELTITPGAIDFLFPNSGPLSPGTYDVRVCVAGLCGTLPGGLTVTAAPPVISAVSPGSASQGAAGVALTVMGSNFQPGAQMSLSGGGVTVTGTSFVSSTQLTAMLSVAASAATGPRDIVVTNPDGQSATLPGAFVIQPSSTSVQLAATVQPPLVPVTDSQFSDVEITYSLSELSGAGIDLTSANGEFLSSSGAVLAMGGGPLSVAVRPREQIAETLRIPQQVIAAAHKENPFFTFRRVFSGPAGEQVAAVLNIQIVSEALAQFSISQMELRFHNGQGVLTVQRDATVKAYATLTYTGSGLLQGQWVVDGQPLSIVTQVLTYGDTVRIDTPPIPPIPTFASGEHQLTFQVLSPQLGFTAPVISYFVEATSPFQPGIVLVGPDDGAALPVAGVNFQWQVTTGRADIARFRLEVLPESAPVGSTPILAADTAAESYLLQAALSNGFLPGTRYRWQVTGFDQAGRVVASSEVRNLEVAAGTGPSIQISKFDILSGGTSLGSATTSEVRVPTGVEVTLSATVLNAAPAPALGLSVVFKADGQPLDIKTLASLAPNTAVELSTLWTPPAWQTYQVSVEVLPQASRSPLAATARSGLLSVQPGTPAASLAQNQQAPLARQSRQLVVESGALPARLHMAGYTIAVAQYDSQATPDNLSGNGTVTFKNDDAKTPIPLTFQGLKADLATGNVTEGHILEQYSQPIALQMKGHALKLKSFSLAVNYAPFASLSASLMAAPRRLTGANAVLGLTLPAYLNSTAVTFATSLEPGGDFLHVLTPSETPSLALPSLAQGLQITQPGVLVADFSSSSDYTTRAGQTVAADGLLFLSEGRGEVPADTFSSTVQPAQIRVTYDLLPLPQQQAQFNGTLRIVDSDLIQPVLPDGYELRFTSGEIAVAGGQLAPGSLGLDGTVKLPPSVSAGSGLAVVGSFRQLSPISGSLKATDLDLGTVEWGAGPKPFRLLKAKGELTLPYNAPPSASSPAGIRSLGLSLLGLAVPSLQSAGVKVTSGLLESPFETTLAEGANYTGDSVDLQVTSAGITGSIQRSPSLLSRRAAPRSGRIGDFTVRITGFQMAFTDSAVTSSSIDGSLSIPKPAGLELDFTGATLTSTAELLGPKLVVPLSLDLAYWRARVELPAQTSQDLAAAPALLASNDLQGIRLPSQQTGQQTGQQAGGLTRGGFTAVPFQALTLAQSYLAIWGGTLKFTVDPQYGAEELDGFPVTEIKIGADGQIQSAMLGTTSKFLGMNFALDSAQSLTFAGYDGVDAVGSQPLVTMAGTLSFPTFGSRHMEIQHTAMGAEVTNITPDVVQTAGNPDLLHAQASILYMNGFAKGKPFKEFIGLGQLSALKTLYLNGLMMIGKDLQGVYERMGLGIGVDGMKAASLYQGGVVSVAAKLGTGTVSIATGGQGHEEELGVLVGDITEMMAQTNPDTTLLIKTISDALNLAKGIHKDTGGTEGDDIYTALDLGSASLSVAGTFADKKSDGRAKLLAVLRGLDAAIPILQRADAIKQSTETVTILRFLRLGLTAAVLYAEDDSFSTKDWLRMSKELFAAAEPLSQDQTYKLSVKILQGIFQVLENEGNVDEAVLAKIAGGILGAVNQSGLVTHPDARNVMVITQGLLEAVAGAKGMPSPDNFLLIATKVLDVASGGDVNYGDENVKKFLRLGMRTLQAASIAGGGIAYDSAGRMVGDTLATANPTLAVTAGESPLEKVSALVALWNSLKSKPVAQALTEAEALLECTVAGTASGCSGTVTDLMQSAAQQVNQATTPEKLIYALGRMVAIKRKAKLQSAQQELETALTAHKNTIENSARTQMQFVLNQLLAAHQDDSAQWMVLFMGVERQMALLDDAWPCFDEAPTSPSVNCALGILAFPEVTVTDPATGQALTGMDVMDRKMLQTLQSIRSQLQTLVANIPKTPTSGIDLSSSAEPIRRFLGIERQGELLGARNCPDAGETPPEPLTATQQQICQVVAEIYRVVGSIGIAQADLAVKGIQAALVPREATDWMTVYLSTQRQFQILGVGDAGSFELVSFDYDKLLREGIARVLRAQTVEEMRRQIRWNFNGSSPQCTSNSSTALRQLMLLGAIEEPPPSVNCYNLPAASQRNSTLEGVYTAVLASVTSGATMDNLEEGGWLWNLFSDSYLPAIFGHNATEAQQRQVTLINSMNASRAAAQAQLLASMQSAPGSELDTLQKRYMRFGGSKDTLKNTARGWTNSWISQAKQASCAGATEWDQRLGWINEFQDDPWGLGGKNDIHKAMDEMAGRCAGFTAPAQSTAAYLQALEEGSKTAATKIQELRSRLLRGDSEEDLRAELAWLIAEAVKQMSAPFVNGQTEGERALSQVHRQTGYVLKYRQGSRMDRIVAALKLVSEVVRDFNPKAKIPGDLAEKLARTLESFAQSGASSQGAAQAALQFAVSLINEFVPEGGAKKFLLGSYMGLLRETPSEQAALVYIPVGVMGGLALAIGDKIVMVPGGKDVDYAATLANFGLEDEFWSAVGSKYIPGSVKLVQSIIGISQLYNSLRKEPQPSVLAGIPKPVAELLDSIALLEPTVGKYFSALVQPENKLLAPDTRQSEYIANVLLAELGLARQEFPQPLRDVQFKSTCPTFDFTNGIRGLPPSGQATAVCAIDLAREAVRGTLVAAIDPNSPAALNQQAQQQITQMQQDAIFAPAIGDANLSGISGALEYRNGVFNKFELFVTIKAMVFENAAKATYDAGQQLLTFQQASDDPRDAGLLGKYGLQPNSNMLLNTNVFNNPIKTLFFQVRGANANCAQGAYNVSGRMSLAFDTPIGPGWNTGEQTLGLCFAPFGLLLDSNLNASFGVLQSRNNIRLFYGSGNGGLNLRSVLGPEVGPIFGWGAYVNVDMGAGLTAGVNGLHIQGDATGGAGPFEMKKQTDGCSGTFVLTDPSKGEGQCRYGVSANLGFKAGSQNFQGFYLKTQGGVDLWFAYLGVWTYADQAQAAWGGGRFPSDQFGGWTRNFTAPSPLLSPHQRRALNRWVPVQPSDPAGGAK